MPRVLALPEVADVIVGPAVCKGCRTKVWYVRLDNGNAIWADDFSEIAGPGSGLGAARHACPNPRDLDARP